MGARTRPRVRGGMIQILSGRMGWGVGMNMYVGGVGRGGREGGVFMCVFVCLCVCVCECICVRANALTLVCAHVCCGWGLCTEIRTRMHARHCNTPQHTATYCIILQQRLSILEVCTETHSIQHIQSNTLAHVERSQV